MEAFLQGDCDAWGGWGCGAGAAGRGQQRTTSCLSVHLLPLGRPVSACTRWTGYLHPPAFMPQLVRNSHLTCLQHKKRLMILGNNNETLSDEKSDIWKSKRCHGPLIDDTLPSFKPHPTTPTPVSKPLPPIIHLKSTSLRKRFKKRERFLGLEVGNKFKGPNTEITKGGLFLADGEILSSDLKENSAFSRDLFCKEDQFGILCGPGRWWGSGKGVRRGHLDFISAEFGKRHSSGRSEHHWRLD